MSTGINKLEMELTKKGCLLHSYQEQTLLEEVQNKIISLKPKACIFVLMSESVWNGL